MAAIRDSQKSSETAHVLCMVRVLLAAGFILIAGCVQAPAPTHHGAEAFQETTGSDIDPQLRLEYPFSLIPGGVSSDTELEAARSADPILAEHYADVGFLRPAILSHDQLLYASYRQGGRQDGRQDGRQGGSIVWTSSPIRVRAGEMVLADRSGNLVRGRCGNRLSDTPRQPVAFVPPAERAFEMPEVSFIEPPVLPQSLLNPDMAFVSFPPFPVLETPASGKRIRSVPVTVAPPAAGWTEEPVASATMPFGAVALASTHYPGLPHPAVAPEPGSVWLLVVGGMILVGFGWKAGFRRTGGCSDATTYLKYKRTVRDCGWAKELGESWYQDSISEE
jgi:hypothetical protein